MSKLGILAGGGSLPKLLVDSCRKKGREFFLISFKNQLQPEVKPAKGEHAEVALGAVGKVLELLKKNGVEQVVMAGKLSKPGIFDLRLDGMALKLMAKLSKAGKGDDALLRGLCSFLEEQGFDVVGASDVCPDVLAKKKVYSKTGPTAEQKKDVALGLKTVRALGDLDIGQAVIVKDGVVLGVEAIEGTSALIERCAGLRGKSGKGGILVKCAKPNQDRRVDLPTIGAETVQQLAQLKYDGVAVAAGEALVLDEEEVVKSKIFVVGV